MGKVRVFPGLGLVAVTGYTVGGETQLPMVGIPGRVVVGQMAADTLRGEAFVHTLSVAVVTVRQFVLPSQDKGIVIEFRAFPGPVSGPMTNGAIGGKSRPFMIRILDTAVFGPVAGYAFLRESFELTTRVAFRAESGLMLSPQDKEGVRKLGIVPGLGSGAVADHTV